MDAVKVGNFIRELRKNNNLTQKMFGEKYGVTYQAVSKWERGINIPDIGLLRDISKDFKVSLESILDGEVEKKKEVKKTKKVTTKKKTVKTKKRKKVKKENYITKTINKIKELVKTFKTKKKKEKKVRQPILIYPYVFGFVGFSFISLLVLLLFMGESSATSFNFKTLSTTCDEFKVTGVIAYDNKKSSVNISNIDYCGGDDEVVYDSISCELYEQEGKTKKLVAKCNKDGKATNLGNYLKEVEVKVDNYEQQCKSYKHNNLYLEIKANKEKKTTLYTVDLTLNNNCSLEVEE